MNTVRRVTLAFAVAVSAFQISAQDHDSAAAQELELFGPGAHFDRDRLIELVLERNPRVEAMRFAIEASQARIETASSWDDPRLSASVAPLSLDDSRIGGSLGISQEIPWPDRLAARNAVAVSEASAAQAELAELRTTLAYRTSALFDRWYLVHRALELNTHHYHLVEQMKESAESQYVVGSAAQQDPLQAEVRATRLLREKAELEADRRTVRAAINTLMRRGPGEPLPPPPARLAPPPRPEGPVNPPRLEIASAQLARAEAELHLARLERKPDLMAMGEYSSMFMDKDHRLMVGVSLRLPVQRERIAATVRAAEAEVDSMRSLYRAVLDDAELEYQNARFELESNLETLELYEDRLIPASQDQTEAAQAGFIAGRNSFLAVLDAENNLQEVLLGYHTVLSEAWSAAAAVEVARGNIPFVQEGFNHE